MRFDNWKKIILFFLLGSFCFAIPSFAKSDLGIVTGSNTGTYIKFGNDIKRLLKRHHINLDVHTSAGSLENIYSIWKLPKAQLGIVQSDVLAYIATRPKLDLRKIVDKLRLVYPLYNEEVHVLATNDISSLDDLEGKRVAIGSRGSGTSLTAETILKISGININPVYIGGKDALASLKQGDIDAMFYVAGFPVTLFKDNVTRYDKLHLVPILDKGVSEIYNVYSIIPAGTYSFQSEDVPTVAVKATLITYAYKRANCQLVGKVARIIENEIDWLKENGHPKWKDVDLDFKLNGWERYECIDKNYDSTRGHSANGLDDFLKAISEQ